MQMSSVNTGQTRKSQIYEYRAFTDVSQARDMIQMINDLSLEGQANRFSIIAKETGEVIGTCGFNMIDQETAELKSAMT
ncbi:hypothetical protein PO124_12255 [Bacillus licheniformis]|nr:hypothetical protein [Bacillus licheniformis]